MYQSPKVKILCFENAQHKLLDFKNFENKMYRKYINSKVGMNYREYGELIIISPSRIFQKS